MGRTAVNGIELEYEVLGDQGADPLLLIMGLGEQLVTWPDEFCQLLVDAGHCVIRYDNRDAGLSTKFHEAGMPDLQALATGGDADIPYTMEDMAQDAVGLLGALSIERAHIVGASLGGMIAQTVAIHHAPQVKTLTSIMSATGNPQSPPPTPEAAALLTMPRPPQRDARIEQSVKSARLLHGDPELFDEAQVRERAAFKYDRSSYTAGVPRQLAAIIKQGNREPLLADVAVPTLVLHGTEDPLVPHGCGEMTAAAITGARLELIEGMGHSLPAHVHGELARHIIEHTGIATG